MAWWNTKRDPLYEGSSQPPAPDQKQLSTYFKSDGLQLRAAYGKLNVKAAHICVMPFLTDFWGVYLHKNPRARRAIMQSIKMSTMFILLVIWAISMTTACQKTYYNAWEKLGVHKRDIMVERVEKARDSQNDAKEQFQSALEQFSSQLNFKGGNLEEKYNTLRDAYEKSKTKAEEVSSRIAKVEDVSEALFEEWQDELQQYSNAKLRADSEKKLAETRIQYKKLIRAMKKAEERMKPVLTAFHDQVLYLKHNLNTQAILSLQSELVAVEEDIASLIREMEASIREADSFIRTMGK